LYAGEREESNALRIAAKAQWRREHSEHLQLDNQWLIVALKWYQKVSFAKFKFLREMETERFYPAHARRGVG